LPQTDRIEIVQYNRGAFSVVQDEIISETLLTLLINDTIVTSFICSWMHIEYLIIGYLFCEGWIGSMDDLLSLEIREPDAQGLVYIPKNRFQNKNRGSFLSTGCGHKMQSSTPLIPSPRRIDDFHISPSVVIESMKQFQKTSALFQSTGGVHSVALVSPNCGWVIEEDIGRHNALDKTLGALANAGFAPHTGAIIITSRASFEMVQKTAALGIGAIAAVSAPTAAAIRLAERLNVTLVGFLRAQSCVTYTHSRTGNVI